MLRIHNIPRPGVELKVVMQGSGGGVYYNRKFIWDGPVTVNGKPLEMRGSQTVESEWVNGTFGEPHLRISYKGITEDLWFD
jgi:hypothetical protein